MSRFDLRDTPKSRLEAIRGAYAKFQNTMKSLAARRKELVVKLLSQKDKEDMDEVRKELGI